jgi:hypothetical protein
MRLHFLATQRERKRVRVYVFEEHIPGRERKRERNR